MISSTAVRIKLQSEKWQFTPNIMVVNIQFFLLLDMNICHIPLFSHLLRLVYQNEARQHIDINMDSDLFHPAHLARLFLVSLRTTVQIIRLSHKPILF